MDNEVPEKRVMKLRSIKAAKPEIDKKGQWIDSLELPGVRFLVSSLHLPEYQTAMNELETEWQATYRSKGVPPEVRTLGIARLLRIYILHDWAGFDEPYSPELAAEMTSTYEDRPLIYAIQQAATIAGMTKYEFVAAGRKNSDQPSGTTSG